VIFKEYAIQPDVLNTKDNCRYWLSLMGLEKGRQISRYPKRWKKMVYESISHLPDKEKKYIEERLFNLPGNVLKRRIHEYDPNPSIGWFKNAIIEDNIRPFHAIIANDNPTKVEKVLTAEETDETNNLMIANPSTSIQRDLKGITDWVIPLIEQSSLIVFVDPFFSPSNADYLCVLRRFIEIIIDTTPNGTNKKILYHSRETIGGTNDYFINACNEKILPMVNQGLEISFFRWPNNEIHNRFILTNSHRGVSYNYGLGLGNPNHDKNDEINYLSDDAYTQRWNQYVEVNPPPVCVITS